MANPNIKIIAKGRKKIIHVNQHKIKKNKKICGNEPVLTVKSKGVNIYGHTVNIVSETGEILAKVVYRPNNPLSCGAHCWIETKKEIIVQRENDENTAHLYASLPKQPAKIQAPLA